MMDQESRKNQEQLQVSEGVQMPEVLQEPSTT